MKSRKLEDYGFWMMPVFFILILFYFFIDVLNTEDD